MPDKRAILRPHAPLMWVTLALMAGYSWAETYEMGPQCLGVMVALGLVALAGAWIARKHPLRSRVYLALGMCALAGVYYQLRGARQEPTLEQLAPREAEVVIEPVQSFALRAESGREGGLGRVHGGALDGQKINYDVRWELDEPLVLHSQVKMFGVLAPNPRGAQGFEEYLERSHVGWSLTRGQAVEVTQPAHTFWQGIAGLRLRAVEVLHRRWHTHSDNGLLAAMVMGDKAELTPTQKENFVRSGTMHLVAISGLNVMAVAVVLWGLLRLSGLPRTAQSALVVAILALYALTTGSGASVWRAWGMVALGLTAWALRRQVNLWAIVVLAATLSLLIEPLMWMHAGWRLSFGVVAGIILGMGIIDRWGGIERLPRLVRPVVATLAMSLVAGLSVAPMTAAYWGLAQPFGFVLNAVAVSLSSFVTILGTFSWLVAWLPGASAAVNELAYVLLGWIDAAIAAYLKLPGAVVEVTQAKSAGVEIWGTLTVLGIFYIFSRWGGRKNLRGL